MFWWWWCIAILIECCARRGGSDTGAGSYRRAGNLLAYQGHLRPGAPVHSGAAQGDDDVPQRRTPALCSPPPLLLLLVVLAGRHAGQHSRRRSSTAPWLRSSACVFASSCCGRCADVERCGRATAVRDDYHLPSALLRRSTSTSALVATPRSRPSTSSSSTRSAWLQRSKTRAWCRWSMLAWEGRRSCCEARRVCMYACMCTIYDDV